MKTILLAITGMSPQVVTETLYGIHQSGMEWPEEIQIITTKKGKEQAILGLITPDKHEHHNRIEKFCMDYDIDQIPVLNEPMIHVIPGANGEEVDDARTFEDQEALADFIVHKVGELCSDKDTLLHASLAGGRKTMTFFLGYAMTLFARSGDRLSHVLVDQEFEGLSEFYYPTPVTCKIKGHGENSQLDANKASVMLAELPFIRQRDQLNSNFSNTFGYGKLS